MHGGGIPLVAVWVEPWISANLWVAKLVAGAACGTPAESLQSLGEVA